MRRLTILVFLIPLCSCVPDVSEEQPRNKGRAEGPAGAGGQKSVTKPTPPIVSANRAVFSQEGDRLLVAFHKKSGAISTSANLVLYEIPSGKILWTTAVAEPLSLITILPGGKVGLLQRNKSLELWDLTSGKFEKRVVGPLAQDFLATALVSKKLALAAVVGGVLRLWEMDTWQEKWTNDRSAAIVSAMISPDGQFVFCGFNDQHAKHSVEMWDWRENKLILSRSKSESWGGPACFSPDSQMIIGGETAAANPQLGKSNPTERSLVLIRLDSGKVLKRFKTTASVVIFSEKGQRLVVGSQFFLKAFDVKNESLLWESSIPFSAHTIVFLLTEIWPSRPATGPIRIFST